MPLVCAIVFSALFITIGDAQTVSTETLNIRRIKALSDSTFLIEETDADSNLLFIGTMSSLDPDVRNGRFRFYNESGRVEAIGFYYHDIPYGKWVYYDKAGRITRMLDFKYVLEFISRSPNAAIFVRDSQPAVSMPASQKEFDIGLTGEEEQSFDSFVTVGDNVEGTIGLNSTVATSLGQDVDYFTQYIREHLVYPVFARDKGISGIVEVQLRISDIGNISEISILSGGNIDLNMEALRVVLEAGGGGMTSGEQSRPADRFITVPVSFVRE